MNTTQENLTKVNSVEVILDEALSGVKPIAAILSP